jgi:hypothetical protein
MLTFIFKINTQFMKTKIVLLVTFLALSFVGTYAQGFRLGAKAGANLMQISDRSYSDGFKLGYQLGGFIELDFSKTFGVEPEVLFSQTNTNYANIGLSNINEISNSDSWKTQ